MRGIELELGSRLNLDAAEPLVVQSFATQRRRLLDSARGLAVEDWTSRTRCSEWDVRELVLHVVGATDSCRETLTGERPVFGEGFDPNSSPNEFVDSRAGASVATTLEQLDASIATTIGVIDGQRRRASPLQVRSIWGEQIDWRLFVTHFFFDGWIHERDLLLPLGREPAVADADARLAAAYALHIGGIVAGGFGIPLTATVRLGGVGGGAYRIVVDGFDVRISVSALVPEDGPTNGTAVAVTDAIAGRGPELATVLDASPDVVDALSGVGAFLQG